MRRVVPTLLATIGLAATTTLATGAAGPSAGAAPQSTATTVAAGAAAGIAPQPSRVVIIVVDALSRQVVDRYDMFRVQALMRRGTDFPQSLLGHLGAETVVSHNVLTSGQLPKHMGWADEYMRDVDEVLAEGSEEPDNPYWLTGSLSSDQMFALQEHARYPKLADYLHAARPGSTVATVSPETYAAWGMGGAGSDMIVTFSGRDFDCDGDGVDNWRGPDGIDVPRYLSGPRCGRYYVDSAPDLDYDTFRRPAWMYPLDGNRYTVGRDPEHQGGDVWATDAALKIMRNEPDWSGMFVSLPGVDKAAHMWGGIDDPGGPAPLTHLERATTVADEQVGRVMGYLRRSGQLDETLVVLTADHGQQPSRNFHGVNAAGRGDYNWYYGDAANGDYLDPAPDLRPLIDTGNVDVTFQDGAIRSWLDDRSPEGKAATAAVMARLPDVTAVYARTGGHYQKLSHLGRAGMGDRELAWFRDHAQKLVDSEAAPYGPDLIALLRDNTSYGVAGDHGGINRTVQQIPITFVGAGTSSTDRQAEIRLVDVMATILQAMGIEATFPMDGRARPLG